MRTKFSTQLWENSTKKKKRPIGGSITAVVVLAGIGLAKLSRRDEENKPNGNSLQKCRKNAEYFGMSMSDDNEEDEIEDEYVKPLNEKNSRDDFTQEELDTLDDYEFGEEWLDRDEELWNMPLEDYDEIRRIEEYGLCDDEMDCGDDD